MSQEPQLKLPTRSPPSLLGLPSLPQSPQGAHTAEHTQVVELAENLPPAGPSKRKERVLHRVGSRSGMEVRTSPPCQWEPACKGRHRGESGLQKWWRQGPLDPAVPDAGLAPGVLVV